MSKKFKAHRTLHPSKKEINDARYKVSRITTNETYLAKYVWHYFFDDRCITEYVDNMYKELVMDKQNPNKIIDDTMKKVREKEIKDRKLSDNFIMEKSMELRDDIRSYLKTKIKLRRKLNITTDAEEVKKLNLRLIRLSEDFDLNEEWYEVEQMEVEWRWGLDHHLVMDIFHDMCDDARIGLMEEIIQDEEEERIEREHFLCLIEEEHAEAMKTKDPQWVNSKLGKPKVHSINKKKKKKGSRRLKKAKPSKEASVDLTALAAKFNK